MHLPVEQEKGLLFALVEVPAKSSLFDTSMYPQKIGYSEYLSEMSDVVLSWDEKNKLLYICDGATGYVYNLRDNSLGKCPANITGITPQGSTLYVTAPAAINIPDYSLCTDIHDFGTHNFKTIHALEFGTNVTGTLEAAIDYRDDFTADFTQTGWTNVSSRGTVFITALGREFRFKSRMANYEYSELDYITIKGIVHDH